MLSAPNLPAVIARQPGAPVDHATFARRLPVRSLFRIKSAVAAPGSPASLTSPDFFFVSGSPYRFNPSGIATLYFGEGEPVAAAEVKQHPGLRGFAYEPTEPHAVFHVTVNLSAVLDVTLASTQTDLATSSTELLSNWRLLSPLAPTQILGEAVFNSNAFEGIRYQSAAMAKESTTAFCLAIFVQRLRKGSFVSLFDPNGIFSQRIDG